MSIELQGVHKRFGNFDALSDISLSVREGELLALLGPSGSGKTTLLRIIAGLEAADAGDVLIDGNASNHRTGRGGQVGFVFQHYALFRHLSVFENIAFGLRVRPAKTRPSKSEIQDKVNELLRLVQLEGTGHRYPAQLSGGQRQRVALARALAIEPKVLLLDEPFGALDAQVRQELRQWLRNLHDKLGMTSVFVTHDQEEALEVADRVVVMNKGRVEQIGTPEDVYGSPANPFVYHFLGRVNLFHGRVQNGRVRLDGMETGGEMTHHENEPVVGYVRPHDLEVTRDPNGDDALQTTIRHIHAVGPIVRLDLTRLDADDPISAEITRDQYDGQDFSVGDIVYVKPRKLGVFPDFDPSI